MTKAKQSKAKAVKKLTPPANPSLRFSVPSADAPALVADGFFVESDDGETAVLICDAATWAARSID